MPSLKRLERLRFLDAQYQERTHRHRQLRQQWVQQLTAGANFYNATYGRFIHGLKSAGVRLDRKVLSVLVAQEPASFRGLVCLSEASDLSKYRESARRQPFPSADWRPPRIEQIYPDEKKKFVARRLTAEKYKDKRYKPL
mmetsp:Transcript_13012/g.40062  ORF Transcript_13012/g.40062 Transcript_13012/m.40062 type:complete len:140 (-) Transcript_13012:3202-3621(-)